MKCTASSTTLYAKCIFHGQDARSPFIDTRPNLAEGVPEKREYHAHLFMDDHEVGDQSAIVSVML
ncbi:MAG: hypothetical protein K9J06_03235 [Flavobacteriales bacterium]|nr:hypothetical protein [Flavobacteriales bacterium]